MNVLPDLIQDELTQIETEPQQAVKRPRMYKVIIFNDDYTPMNFVVEILEYFFHMNNSDATEVMLRVHFQGSAICGVYSKGIAETKVALVNERARSHQHPLLCEAVPESESVKGE